MARNWQDFDVYRIKDLVLRDAVALQGWNYIVDEIVQSPIDALQVKRRLKNLDIDEAVLHTLQIWHASGHGLDSLLDIFRRQGLDFLVETVSIELGALPKKRAANRRTEKLSKPDRVGDSNTSTSFGATLSRRSEVNDGIVITESLWIVSLARKPDSVRPQHAFLIVEGIFEDKATIWFMDFVSGGGWQFGTHPGKIRSYSFGHKMDAYPADAREWLIYSRQHVDGSRMMNPRRKDKLISVSWQVEASKVLKMVDRINEAVEQGDFPKFVITGRGTIFSSQEYSGTDDKEQVHNSFTWSKEQLASLSEKSIDKILANQDEFSWFAQIGSRTLADSRPPQKSLLKTNIWRIGILSALLLQGIALYYVTRS